MKAKAPPKRGFLHQRNISTSMAIAKITLVTSMVRTTFMDHSVRSARSATSLLRPGGSPCCGDAHGEALPCLVELTASRDKLSSMRGRQISPRRAAESQFYAPKHGETPRLSRCGFSLTKGFGCLAQHNEHVVKTHPKSCTFVEPLDLHSRLSARFYWWSRAGSNR